MTWWAPSRHRVAEDRSAPLQAGPLWLCTAALLAAVGVSGTAGLIGWGATWWLFIGLTMFGWLWSLLWLLGDAHSAYPVLAAGPLSGLMIVVAAGLLDLLGPAAFVVAGTLVMTHPAVFQHLRAELGRGRLRPASTEATVALVDPFDPVRPSDADAEPAEEWNFVVADAVTTADLCHAWCSSYEALQGAQSVGSLLSTVEMRALYLDELERRLGDNFGTWMSSGDRGAQNPLRSLRALDLDEP